MKQKVDCLSVLRIFNRVKGVSVMVAASILVRAAYKLSCVALSVILAFIISRAFMKMAIASVWCGVLLLFPILISMLSYADTYISHDTSFKVVKSLQDKMYEHMDMIAPGGLEGINTADASVLILSDISVFEWFVAHCLVEWAGTIMVLLICFGLYARVSVFSASFVLIMLVFMLCIPLFFTAQAGEKGLVMKRLFGQLNGTVSDGVCGYKDIIAFHNIEAFFNRLHSSSQEFSKCRSKYAVRGELEKTVEAVISCVAIIGGIIIAGHELDNANIIILPIYALCASIVVCVQNSLSEGTNFGFVFGAASRMEEIFNIDPPVVDRGTKQEKDVAKDGIMTLGLKNIFFHYDDKKPILNGISFEINSADLTCIVGASGEGKSTITQLIQRFRDVEQGSISINGTDVRDISLYALRNLLMVIPQETYIFHGSVRSNLLMVCPDAGENEIVRALECAKARAFIDNLNEGIDTELAENGASLSGGERQRIALAQGFLRNPPILVLDEATSALDAQNEQSVIEKLKEKRADKITIMITHRISSMKMADRIVFLKDGEVMDTGSFEELITRCDQFRGLILGECCEG